MPSKRKSQPTPPGTGSPRRPLLGGGELLQEPTERRRQSRDKFHPVSPEEAFAVLEPQARRLVTDLEALPERLATRHVVFEATLLPNYLASTYFPSELLADAGLYPVGIREARGVLTTAKQVSEDEPTKTLLVAGPREKVQAFARSVLRGPGIGPAAWEDLRKVSRLSLAQPNEVVRSVPPHAEGEVLTWEAVLHAVGRSQLEFEDLAEEGFRKWIRYVESLGGDVDAPYRRVVNGLTFVPIALHAEAIHQAARFNMLRAVRPMPKIRPLPAPVLRAVLPRPPPPPSNATPTSSLKVGIFDGGVDATSPYFFPYVQEHALTPLPPDEDGRRHGSLVTSAFLYGDVADAKVLPRPPAYVEHFRVYPIPTPEKFDESMYWVLDRILETVRARGLKHVNLSLGPDVCVTDDSEPHRWTAELDALAHAGGVLFTTAVGNNGEVGDGRIQVPSDMINGVGVGACPLPAPASVQRAPFSAKGPGRSGQRVQPVGVSFGGSEDREFVGFGVGSRLVAGMGTSFAAPSAMRSFTGLAAELGSARSTPHTIRAFAAHFAERPGRGASRQDVGHGRLRDSYASAWECGENEVTVLYQDQVLRGAPTAMRLPLPIGIPGDAKIGLRWTLAFTSPVRPGDASDYSGAGFEITFRPHERRRSLWDTERDEQIGVLDSEIDAAEIKRIGRDQQIRVSPVPVSRPWSRRGGGTERELRDAGKWETLVQGSARLEAGELFQPRLDLIYLARNQGVLVDGVPPLSMTMLVTLAAPKGIPLYDLVRTQFYVLVPLVNVQIPISSAG